VRLVLADHPELDESSNRNKHEEVFSAWGKVAPDLTYTHAPGNHFTLLKSPNVRILARLIEADK
jgi:arthrofactin-type cyclic lipopeptide synthetase C